MGHRILRGAAERARSLATPAQIASAGQREGAGPVRSAARAPTSRQMATRCCSRSNSLKLARKHEIILYCTSTYKYQYNVQ